MPNIIDILWGKAEVPENRTLVFLLSNASYFALGLFMLMEPTGEDLDRLTHAWILLTVGFVSTMFHASQTVHGHEDARTIALHSVDVILAIVSFLGALYIRGISNTSALTWILVSVSIPLFLYNGPYYWLSHSVWHALTAVILFTLLRF